MYKHSSYNTAWAVRGMGALYISKLGLSGIAPLDAIYLPHRHASH